MVTDNNNIILENIKYKSLPWHWRCSVVLFETKNPDYKYDGIQWTYKDDIWTARIHYKLKPK